MINNFKAVATIATALAQGVFGRRLPALPSRRGAAKGLPFQALGRDTPEPGHHMRLAEPCTNMQAGAAPRGTNLARPVRKPFRPITGLRIDPFTLLAVAIGVPMLLGFAVLIGPFYLFGETVTALRERGAGNR